MFNAYFKVEVKGRIEVNPVLKFNSGTEKYRSKSDLTTAECCHKKKNGRKCITFVTGFSTSGIFHPKPGKHDH